MLVVGYDAEYSTPYWLVKNSWGDGLHHHHAAHARADARARTQTRRMYTSSRALTQQRPRDSQGQNAVVANGGPTLSQRRRSETAP